MSNEYTEEEVKIHFLRHLVSSIKYWDRLPGKTTTERLEGLAFSFLVSIDGDTYLPAFILAPCPHEDDKAFCINEGDDYYPENHGVDVTCDIAGSLHEKFCEMTKK